MEQKLIKGFVAFSAIIICQQRMCCLNMFVIIRNEQGYFKEDVYKRQVHGVSGHGRVP